jgi:hypothetical protein
LARLVLFGALACGSVASQEASTPVGPPNIQVISRSWAHFVFKTKPPPAVPNSQSVEHVTDRPMEPIDPTPKVIETTPPRQIYVYSAEILNAGPGDIKALSWDYLFRDPATHDELKRQTGFFVGKIQVNQKKKLPIRTPSSPPKVISAGSMNANGSSFDERVSIQGILFADGSFWENPERKGISCEKLRILQRGPVKSSNEIIG